MLTILRVWRLTILLAWTLALIPVQFLFVVTGSRLQSVLPIVFHRFVARVLRVAVEVRGTPSTERPVLFIANHSSWLDIVTLSTVTPVSFVAKSEIARWPGFSILAKLQRSVFVERRRGKTKEGVSDIQTRLRAGDNIILFGEGTLGDGNSVAPFKSAMFSASEIDVGGGRLPVVQPVSVAYTHLDGFPLGRRARHRLTWYGRMSLPSHIWQLLGQGHARVVIEFNAPVRATDFASRKDLALHCQRKVAEGHARAINGRAPLAPAADPAADPTARLAAAPPAAPAALPPPA
jgi:1-acyl-sn-glycerol-3-phosphate acyltransferase